MRRLSICSKFQQGYGVLQGRTFRLMEKGRFVMSVYHTAALVATLALGICLSLICFDAPWQLSFCLSPLFCVSVSWSVKKKKKLGGGEIKKKKKVDVAEVSVREQNWNQGVAFKWKTASQSSLTERQHLQLFHCSLNLLLSQFLLSEPPHAHYFCPIWVRIPAVPVCPWWHQWNFVWPTLHLVG